MNLSKELKKKRDSENRLNQRSPQKVYFEGAGFIDLSELAKKTDLVTAAYNTAVEGGYTGTSAEFKVDLASIEGLEDAITAIVGS